MRKQTLRDRIHYWTPDRESTFSVGIRASSEVLEPEDLEFINNAFDLSWESLKVNRHRYPKPRPGSRFDVHLKADDLAIASSNIVAARNVLERPEFAHLRDLDPAVAIDLHAQQNLADVGRIPPIYLDLDALAALSLSGFSDNWFDIDQYGAAGQPLAERAFHWYTDQFDGQRSHHALEIVEHGVTLVRFPWRNNDEARCLHEQVSQWLAANALPQGSTCVANQIIRVPGSQGIGFGLDSSLLSVLSHHGLELELRTRTRFGLRNATA
jgi:hypothetical protein